MMSHIFTSSIDHVDVTFYLQDRKLENPIIVDPASAKKFVIPVTGIHIGCYDLFSRHVVILSDDDLQRVSNLLRDQKWVQFFKANRLFLSEEEYPYDFPEYEKIGKNRNLQEAIAILKNLSDRFEFPPAQNSLALCYYWGIGVEHDLNKMVDFFSDASAQRFAISTKNHGWCYQEGKGAEKNFRVAFYLYKDAFERGLTGALCDIARLYENATPPNTEEAMRLYRYAAKLGVREAENRLSIWSYASTDSEAIESESFEVMEGFPVGREIDIFSLVPRVQLLVTEVQQLKQQINQRDSKIAELQAQLQT